MKKLVILLLGIYTLVLFSLLIAGENAPNDRARLEMGLTLFMIWVIAGGAFQLWFLKRNPERYQKASRHPILSFAVYATALACIEEGLATLLTNLAPFFGGTVEGSFITASTNYFHVIFFHSVIVFIPMFFTLGWLLKKYSFSPFAAFTLFGLVGVFAEFTLSGPAVFLNAPFWILLYGLMVYLPSFAFVNTERKKVPLILYPISVIAIALSAIATFWIPLLLDTGKHFL